MGTQPRKKQFRFLFFGIELWSRVYINKFRVAGLLSDPLNPYFEHIFETGVDEMV